MGTGIIWTTIIALVIIYGIMQFFTKYGKTDVMKSIGGLVVIVTVVMMLVGVLGLI